MDKLPSLTCFLPSLTVTAEVTPDQCFNPAESRIYPRSYDHVNGGTGSYTYFDDSYSGKGNPAVAQSYLSGGLGELTDGVIVNGNWNVNGNWVRFGE